MALAAMRNSPPGAGAAPYADPAMPTPSSTRPTRGERSDGSPVTTPTREDRDHVLAGGDPGRHHRGQQRAEHPEPGDPGQVQPRHLERPEPVVGPGLEQRFEEPRDPDARARRRRTAATLPSTSALAMTTRRDCFGVPPVAAIRARLRCCLRALTANAGPASSTTSIRAITTISAEHGDRRVVGAALLDALGDLGRTAAGRDHRTRGHDGADAVELAHRRPRDRRRRRPATRCCRSVSTPKVPSGPAATGKVRTRRRLGDPDDRRVGGGVVRGELQGVADVVALVEHRLVDRRPRRPSAAAGPT